MKDNLESARWDWDKEEMWADIEQHLPPAKKPKRILPIWWISGFLALSLVVASFYFWQKNDSNNSISVAEVEISGSENKMYDNNTNDSQHESFQKNINEITTDNILNVNLTEETNVSSSKATILNDIKNNQYASSVNRTSNSSEVKGENVVNAVVEKSNEVSSSRINSDQNNLSNGNSSEINSSKKSKEAKPKTSKSLLEQMIDRHNAEFLQSRAIPLQKINALNSLRLRYDRELFNIPVLNRPNDFIKPSKNNWLSSLAFYTNYSLLSRNVVNLQSDNTVFEARSISEKMLEGFGAQLNYRVHFNNNFFAELGLEYQRVNEVMNFNERLSSQEEIQSDSASYFITFAGETKFLAGEKTQTRIEKTLYTSYNEHHFFNAPIHLGYSKKLGALSLNVIAGPVLNIYQSYKGDAIDQDLRFVEDYQVSDFDNSLLSAFDAGLYFDYNLTHSFSLSSGINYRKALSDFTIDNAINQSYDKIEFKLGILFKI